MQHFHLSLAHSKDAIGSRVLKFHAIRTHTHAQHKEQVHDTRRTCGAWHWGRAQRRGRGQPPQHTATLSHTKAHTLTHTRKSYVNPHFPRAGADAQGSPKQRHNTCGREGRGKQNPRTVRERGRERGGGGGVCVLQGQLSKQKPSHEHRARGPTAETRRPPESLRSQRLCWSRHRHRTHCQSRWPQSQSRSRGWPR
jgi:hypothetical protein